jgi:hypothetical protein
MEALATHLRETRTTPKAFAKLVGLDADRFERILAGYEAIETSIAHRMVDATGGALLMVDLVEQSATAAPIIDMRSRFASAAAEIDTEKLAEILSMILPRLIGGARRLGDEHLPRLAADAAANTYAALSTVTTRRGPDRLIQALRPVFAEILSEMSAPASDHRRLPQAIEEAAAIYFQEPQRSRRA